MYYEHHERDGFDADEEARDPFEAFGETQFDPEREFEDAAPATAPADTPARDPAARVKTPFSWAGFAGGFAAFLWVTAAIGGPLSYYGLEAVTAMDPAMQAGLIALAFGPALLFWVAASAAGEAMKARTLAADLARLAYKSRLPIEAGEADAQRLGATVRTEIEALNDAVAAALHRLSELEHSAKRSSVLFEEAVDASRKNTETMTQALRHERDALADINTDLRGQTEAVANSIGRQVRLMREASKLVKTEVTAAEDALQSHLASFAASATMIGERTTAFHHAADQAAAATASLNGTMAAMLEGMTEATRLAGSAQKSSEQAVMAANETAGALRETTRSAVFEAKRAAQLIRAEAQAMQDSAADTLSRLQDAAQAARTASEESQAAADRHAATIEKRLVALASTASATKNVAAVAPRTPAPRQAERTAERPRPLEAATAHVRTDVQPTDLRAAANAALARSQSRGQARADAEPRRIFKGFGSWGNFVPQTRAEESPAAANEDFDLMAFSAGRANPDSTLKDSALDLVTEAGVDLDDVLGPGDLDRIARSSRGGAAARRAAVMDAAPGAVTRIARYVKRNSKAHLVANEFRSRPDLAKSERKTESSDLVRAYLLIDAALA